MRSQENLLFTLENPKRNAFEICNSSTPVVCLKKLLNSEIWEFRDGFVLMLKLGVCTNVGVVTWCGYLNRVRTLRSEVVPWMTKNIVWKMKVHMFIC